jgi:hypothetical protein
VVEKLWKGGWGFAQEIFRAKAQKARNVIAALRLCEKHSSMTTAGYSGTPLLKKLGIKDSMKVQLINAPDNYFKLLETDISKQIVKGKITPDLVHLFAKSYKDFEAEMKKLKPLTKSNPDITIWVSWYKKSAGIATDITEDIIRAYALKNDLVDVKVCAVSDIWSGLKLVVPVAKR